MALPKVCPGHVDCFHWLKPNQYTVRLPKELWIMINIGNACKNVVSPSPSLSLPCVSECVLCFPASLPLAPPLFVLAHFLFFNWSLVNLQCYVSLKCTAEWFSYTHIYILFQIFFSIICITRYWILFTVLYSKTLLLTYFIYSSVYMLIPNS